MEIILPGKYDRGIFFISELREYTGLFTGELFVLENGWVEP